MAGIGAALRPTRWVWLLLGACGAAAAGSYQLTDSYVGPDFFDKFNFFTKWDPSLGSVLYVNRDEASQLGLIRAQEGEVYIGADMSTVAPVSQGRRSVRVESRTQYNAGLFVVRVKHVPTGIGLWSAIWMFGEGENPQDPQSRWPNWGEFDIVEAVHEQNQVITTLHTSKDCNQTTSSEGRDFSGTWLRGIPNTTLGTDCDVQAISQFPNQGCSQLGPLGSHGAYLNSRGGGTFAAEWDPDAGHMRAWFWPAGTEPGNLQVGGTPDPDSWGLPYAFFSLNPYVCDNSHFNSMKLVVNINFCGDLGKGPWLDDYEDLSSQMSCRDFTEKNPGAMQEAYFSIQRLDVYQRPGPVGSGKARAIYPAGVTAPAVVPAAADAAGPLGFFQLGPYSRPLVLLLIAVGIATAAVLLYRRAPGSPEQQGGQPGLLGSRHPAGGGWQAPVAVSSRSPSAKGGWGV